MSRSKELQWICLEYWAMAKPKSLRPWRPDTPLCLLNNGVGLHT
jgi:hypothetical protein